MLFKDIENKPPYIIAEVGQNHQGSLKIALEYVKVFSSNGAHAIKFQIRNNKLLFDTSAYNKAYNSENSFSDTYGRHREKLELSLSELKKIRNECKKNKVDFICTPFDEESLKSMNKLKVDAIKIASFDMGNLSFIKKISLQKKPIIISTGGGNKRIVNETIKQILKFNKRLTILHCVSEYPCPYDKLGLENISILKKKFPNQIIGLSDHFSGILSGPLAFLNGARVFEKHVTLNRSWKGTDHSFALEPHGFKNFVRDIFRVKSMFKSKDTKSLGKEMVFSKLGKSIILNKNLKKNNIISIDDLSGKIFDKQYLPVRNIYKIIGKRLKKDLIKNIPLKIDDIKN